MEILPEYLNNEIVMQTVNSRTSALEHLSRSYLGQRLVSNPSYYLGSALGQTPDDHRRFLLDMSLSSLEAAGCVIVKVRVREKLKILQCLICRKMSVHNTCAAL
jgi:hypothetical protein